MDIRNANDLRNGFEKSNPRWAGVNSPHMAMVRPSKGAPEMPVAARKAMAPGLVPALGMPAGVVVSRIWCGLGTREVEEQDKAHHQDKSRPSF